jgi:hypothetical protein
MNADEYQIYRLYCEAYAPKFRVGDYVKVVNIKRLDELKFKGSVGKVSAVTYLGSPVNNAVYKLESASGKALNYDWEEDELERWDVNIDSKDKQTATELLEI